METYWSKSQKKKQWILKKTCNKVETFIEVFKTESQKEKQTKNKLPKTTMKKSKGSEIPKRKRRYYYYY